MKKLLVILGPTSTGKTDLALNLAKKFSGVLVSCDSRQVYIGLDIGTGKYPNEDLDIKRGRKFWEIKGIKVWMYDVVSPKKNYTVADYVRDAAKVIHYIANRSKLPIVVGGTGLYLKALLYGLSNLSIPIDQKLRQRLNKLSIIKLQERLKRLSPKKWQSLNHSDRQNPRRLIRAIELETSKRDLGNFNNLENQGLAKDFDIFKIGMIASRDILYQRSDERVISRINQGMIEEAERLKKEGLSLKRMKQLGLEYGVLANYLDGKIKQVQGDQGLIRIMQSKIHGFVRRQLTWFKKEKNVNWFDITKSDTLSKVEKLVGIWYSHFDAKEN